tara:strand:+ start:11269 stop:11658 length:390 start_codon:yes stop_codon:yes gene_type:complete
MITTHLASQARVLGIDVPPISLWGAFDKVPEQIVGNLHAEVANAIVDRFGLLNQPAFVSYSKGFGFRAWLAVSGSSGDYKRVELSNFTLPCDPVDLASLVVLRYANARGLTREDVQPSLDRIRAFARLD